MDAINVKMNIKISIKRCTLNIHFQPLHSYLIINIYETKTIRVICVNSL